jgi:Fe2+ transport system protein B
MFFLLPLLEDSGYMARAAFMSRAITPVFEPMGAEKKNWPASVGILTVVLAKEAVKGFDFWSGIVSALASIAFTRVYAPTSPAARSKPTLICLRNTM